MYVERLNGNGWEKSSQSQSFSLPKPLHAEEEKSLKTWLDYSHTNIHINVNRKLRVLECQPWLYTYIHSCCVWRYQIHRVKTPEYNGLAHHSFFIPVACAAEWENGCMLIKPSKFFIIILLRYITTLVGLDGVVWGKRGTCDNVYPSWHQGLSH